MADEATVLDYSNMAALLQSGSPPQRMEADRQISRADRGDAFHDGAGPSR